MILSPPLSSADRENEDRRLPTWSMWWTLHRGIRFMTVSVSLHILVGEAWLCTLVSEVFLQIPEVNLRILTDKPPPI